MLTVYRVTTQPEPCHLVVHRLLPKNAFAVGSQKVRHHKQGQGGGREEANKNLTS